MDIKNPKSISDFVFLFLQKGPQKIVDLVEMIKQKREKTSKQGVYLVLKDLQKREIVVVHKKQVSLNAVWLSVMNDYFSTSKMYYQSENVDNSFLGLKQGEKIQYFFKSPVVTDAFWSHAFRVLVEISSPKNPVCIYNPHEWFILARNENESDLFRHIADRGQKLALVVGNNTHIDKMARKYFDGERLMYETLSEPLFNKNNYYVNVIGDFIIEVWIGTKISESIDSFYRENAQFGERGKKELLEIVSLKERNKLCISRNSAKATRLRKKLLKYFFV